ncbi:putative membrane protein [Herbinix luporum]|uniref:Putative membrane protein n=1 Tax=Herbinix luporum TaxID=1679721 RepID=A0A0K8J7F3_9FIRM|nr:putative membrane protein [Herbinix luporum]
MWYITIIRILLMSFFNILTFRILLWVLSWRIPGGPRRGQISENVKKRNSIIILLYYFLVTFLITLGFLLISNIVRSEL